MNQPRIIGRRQFVRMTGGAVCLGAAAAISCERRAPAVSVAPFVLEEADIATMQAALSSGALTARALCELYLARIGKLNPQLRAIIETNPDTLTIADQLDRERREKSVQGVLHGIPIVVKDTIETADKMQTAGGSLALVGVPTPADAFVIERLRAAGAIVLGKANLTEWGGPGARMGWSSRGGQTREGLQNRLQALYVSREPVLREVASFDDLRREARCKRVEVVWHWHYSPARTTNEGREGRFTPVSRPAAGIRQPVENDIPL